MLPENVPDEFKPASIRTLILLLIGALLLLVLFSFIFKSASLSDRPLKKELQNVAFSNLGAQENYNNNLEVGFGKQDFGSLEKAFLILVSDYNSVPSSDRRQKLQAFSDYLAKNYPEEFKKAGLRVPCREAECNNQSYSSSLQAIKLGIESNAMIGQDLKKSLLNGIVNASISASSGDSNQEFGDLTTVFVQLKTFYNEDKDDSIKNLAEQVLAEMEKVGPELFKTGLKRGYYNL